MDGHETKRSLRPIDVMRGGGLVEVGTLNHFLGQREHLATGSSSIEWFGVETKWFHWNRWK